MNTLSFSREGQLLWNAAGIQAVFSVDAETDGRRGGWQLLSTHTGPLSDPLPGYDTLVTQVYSRSPGDPTAPRLTRETAYSWEDPRSFHTRLILSNPAGARSPLTAQRLFPLCADRRAAGGGEPLSLGGAPYSQWLFFRSGRHKNDLPSVLCPAKVDGRYLDGIRGLTESGQEILSTEEPPLTLVSDELTLLRSPDACLTLSFLTGQSMLVGMELTSPPQRDGMERLEAIQYLDGVVLEPGECRVGEWLRADAAPDPFSAIDSWTGLKKRMDPPVPARWDRPSVFCTWYYYGGSVTRRDVEENLHWLAANAFPVEVVQLDDGWEQCYGEWEANEKFPGGMASLAAEIQENGFVPGIWTAPFVVHTASSLYRDHPDWILRRRDGSEEVFVPGVVALDITHPAVLDWIEQLYRRLSREGWRYHKLDFTRAPVQTAQVCYHNPRLTRAQAYRRAMEAVRRGMGEGYLLICGGLYSAPAGLAEGHRTGSDVRSRWPEDVNRGFDRDAGSQPGESAPFTMKQSLLRWWMGSLWHCDPDALMVRRREALFRGSDLGQGLLSDDEAFVFTLNQYLSGGLVCFTEPMPELDPDRLALYRHILPPLTDAALPRDLFAGGRCPALLDTAVSAPFPAMEDWHTLTLFQWKDAPAPQQLTLDSSALGAFLQPGRRYTVSDLQSGRIWQGLCPGDRLELGVRPPHSALHLRITPESRELPAILHMDGHLSMGRDLSGWSWEDGLLSFSLLWRWGLPLHMTLRAPDGWAWPSPETARLPEGTAWEAADRLLSLTFPANTGSIDCRIPLVSIQKV